MANVTCPKCDSGNVTIDDGITCEECGEHTPAEKAAHHVAGNHGMSEHSHIKDGGPRPVSACPECGAEAFVALAHEAEESICLSCGTTVSAAKQSYCDICGEPMERGEMSVHSECFNNMMNKE